MSCCLLWHEAGERYGYYSFWLPISCCVVYQDYKKS